MKVWNILHRILSVVMFAVISLVVSPRLKMMLCIITMLTKRKIVRLPNVFFLTLFDFTLMDVYMNTGIK